MKPSPNTPIAGYLKKKSNLRSAFKKRYFTLIPSDGILKSFANSSLLPDSMVTSPNNSDEKLSKNDVDLTGAEIVLLAESCRLKLSIPSSDRKKEIDLEADSLEDAKKWLQAIETGIICRNITALTIGTKVPEVVDWYYHKQSIFLDRMKILEREYKFRLQYYLPTDSSIQSTPILISVNKDQSGLVLRLESRSKKPNRVESINDGRVIFFREMESIAKRAIAIGDLTNDVETSEIKPVLSKSYSENATYTDVADIHDLSTEILSQQTSPLQIQSEQSTPIAKNEVPYDIVITTHEDELILKVDGPSTELMDDWIEAVEEAIQFVNIPVPATTTQLNSSRSTRVSTSAAAVNYAFSMNSGVVYACAGDVTVLLQSLESMSFQEPAWGTFSRIMSDIFKIIPDIKCNKDASAALGERFEDVVRVLADPENGSLNKLRVQGKVNDQMAAFHMNLLCQKLMDADTFLLTLVNAGWLGIAMSLGERLRIKYEEIDKDVITLTNKLTNLSTNGVKNSQESGAILFKKREYDSVVDVKHAVEALGGVQVIYNDPAKVRALARLIESDGSEVQVELLNILESPNYLSKTDNSGGWFYYMCCGCPCTKQGYNAVVDPSLPAASAHRRTPNNKNNFSPEYLEEPLVLLPNGTKDSQGGTNSKYGHLNTRSSASRTYTSFTSEDTTNSEDTYYDQHTS